MAARWAHNPKVAGSNPAPTTNKSRGAEMFPFFILKMDVLFNMFCWVWLFHITDTDVLTTSGQNIYHGHSILYGEYWIRTSVSVDDKKEGFFESKF